jgi:hypothetical protein
MLAVGNFPDLGCANIFGDGRRAGGSAIVVALRIADAPLPLAAFESLDFG